MSSRGKIKKCKNALGNYDEAILIGYYKRNLDVFIERELKVTLNSWQKFVVKKLIKLNNNKK